MLRPAKLWNDTESALDCAQLLSELPGGAAAWATAVGSVPVPAFTITKLRWLRRCEPAVWDQVRSVLLPHDWLTFRLTGRRVTRPAGATPRARGYWSPAENRYRLDLLDRLLGERDWIGMLPEVLEPDAVAGEWRGVGALVAPGTGDNMAAALALGLQPGDLALSFGTSGTAFVVSATPSADESGVVAGFADATGHFLPLVCAMNASKVTDAVMRVLGVLITPSSTAWRSRCLQVPADWSSCRTSTANAPPTGPRRRASWRDCAGRRDAGPGLARAAAVERAWCATCSRRRIVSREVPRPAASS